MFQVLILVCTINIAPIDCQVSSAIEVVRGPEAANEIACGLQSQVYMAAKTPAGSRAGEYVKMICTRTSIGKAVG